MDQTEVGRFSLEEYGYRKQAMNYAATVLAKEMDQRGNISEVDAGVDTLVETAEKILVFLRGEDPITEDAVQKEDTGMDAIDWDVEIAQAIKDNTKHFQQMIQDEIARLKTEGQLGVDTENLSTLHSILVRVSDDLGSGDLKNDLDYGIHLLEQELGL